MSPARKTEDSQMEYMRMDREGWTVSAKKTCKDGIRRELRTVVLINQSKFRIGYSCM